MRKIEKLCQVHVNVCVNERPEPKASCLKVGGLNIFNRLKEQVIREGLNSKVWVTRTGCLGFCNFVGTTVAVHHIEKSSTFLTEVTHDDLEHVFDLMLPK